MTTAKTLSRSSVITTLFVTVLIAKMEKLRTLTEVIIETTKVLPACQCISQPYIEPIAMTQRLCVQETVVPSEHPFSKVVKYQLGSTDRIPGCPHLYFQATILATLLLRGRVPGLERHPGRLEYTYACI